MKRLGEVVLFAALSAAAVVACDPLGTTHVDIASIGELVVPSPSVVIGDVMRDSLGNQAPLQLPAYDPRGLRVLTEPVSISVYDGTTDAIGGTLHVDAQGFVYGAQRDTVGARIFATAGGLEAPMHRIYVSVAPTTATQVNAVAPIVFDTTGTARDSTANGNFTAALGAVLTGADGSGAQGFIVKYDILRTLPSKVEGDVTAFLADSTGRATQRDTTNAQGYSGRIIIIRQSALQEALLKGLMEDTITVRATIRYIGNDMNGTPFLFVIPVHLKP